MSSTSQTYQNLVIYEVYVRNHSDAGTFSAVTDDLPRLKAMGVDIVWFMPIHPIGQLNKKGSLGCPYSIVDYRAVNPEYGTLDDFQTLIATAHELGLKVMIDVVYNHTAHDSILIKDNPHWYHQDEQGNPITTVPEWSDIIDLKYGDPALTEYLIGSLTYWVSLGVDGFRCDVASIIPIEFWQQAKEACAAINPDVIWLAESVSANFVEGRRRDGLSGVSDGELYRVFDLTYDYDIWSFWVAALAGNIPLNHYLGALRLQDCIYPSSYVKMRAVENHDQPRIMNRLTKAQAMAWTAFQAFNKGAFLIYGGQESAHDHTPSLFDMDKVPWGDYELQPFLTKLAHLKKDEAQQKGLFTLLGDEPAITANWQTDTGGLLGIFNVVGKQGELSLPLPDGTYEDVLHDTQVTVSNGNISIPPIAGILRYTHPIESKLVYSPLLDFHW